MQQEKTIIGFDAKRIVRNGTGLGSYGRTLVNDLQRDNDGRFSFRLYAPDKGRDDLRSQIADNPDVQFVYPEGLKFRFQKDLWRTKGIVKDLQRDGVRIFHGLSGELPRGLQRAGIKSVVTIHDLIFMRHPEYYNWIDTKIYTYKFRQACREADRIIAISERTRRDIIELGNVNPDKIDLIYQSFSPRFNIECDGQQLQQVRDKYALPQRYLLNVGSIEERKNVMLAVKALVGLPQDISLVIVGRHTPYTDKVIRLARDNKLTDRITILHGVPDADLPAIYRMAEVFVYPSRYEGFGIPIIEAVSCGLPVVACTGSCLEEAGGPDCLYVDPMDVVGMAAAIKRVLIGAKERERRISLSREYIRRFEGTDVAGQVIDIYDKLIGRDAINDKSISRDATCHVSSSK
jgi:glycosyltransferase involved in cell wall biosynthesis